MSIDKGQTKVKGDILVSSMTASRLISMKSDFNSQLSAFTNSSVDLWDSNKVDGKYIVAYEINDYLDDKNKKMLPKESFRKYI